MKFFSVVHRIVNNKVIIAFLALSTILFLIYIYMLDKSYDVEKENIEYVGFSKSCTANTKEVSIKGHFTKDIPRNKYLYMRIRCLAVEIYKNDKLIYTYGEKGSYPDMLKSNGEVFDGFRSSGISKKDNIEIRMTNEYRNNEPDVYNELLDSFCITDRGTLLIHNITKNGFSLLSGGLVLIYGVVLYQVFLLMKLRKLTIPRSINTCTVYMIVTGMLLVLRYEYVSLFFPYPAYCLMLYTILLFLQVPILSRYLSYFLDTRDASVLRKIEFFGEISIVISIGLQLFGVVDLFEERGRYIIFVGITMVMWMIALIYEATKIKEKKYRIVRLSCGIFVLYAIPEIVNYILRFAPRLMFMNIGMLVFMTAQFYVSVMYIKESMVRMKNLTKMEYELMNNNVELMLSQIQPHFLYNSIASMQMLCKKDQVKAQTALGCFAKYLRTNMDMLKCTKPITFTTEMEHVKNYLYLEKVRFGEMLRVEYDIQETDFLIPAMTVQPIVENAVKHGVGEKDDGGTVKISSFAEKKDYVIIVEDDGIGFDCKELKNQINNRQWDILSNNKKENAMLGIRNVSNRLSCQCNARMNIESTLGYGTKITMRIPM